MLDRPSPLHGAEVARLQGINQCVWAGATQKAYRSHPGDLSLLRYVIVSPADPPGNNGALALPTGNGHEVEIVGGAFSRLQGSSPRPTRRVPA